MFKAARWKSEKNKIKAVFSFQFQAKQVPVLGWEDLVVSLFPVDSAKPTARSEKAAIIDGFCNWQNPVYETVRLVQDLKTGKIKEKDYNFVLSATGSVKSGILGEISINLADYTEAFRPCSVSLPLKAPNAETVLQVTVQRVQGEAEGRGTDEDGDKTTKKQRRTLRSQLSNSEIGEGKLVANGPNEIKLTEVSHANGGSRMKYPSSRTMTVHVESNVNLRKSSSFDAISASSSDSSSERYTPKENGAKNNLTKQDSGSLLSPLGSDETSRDPINGSGNEWSVISAPYGCIDGSSNSSGDTLLREGSHEPDNLVEKFKNDVIALTRQQEVSKLELQTLRKQVVKESKRVQDLSRDLQIIKEERDALARDCEGQKVSKRRAADDKHALGKLQFGGKDLWSILEETKQELDHQKNLNENLHLQLKKTQESNSELILAVRDLEELLQQKNKEACSYGCRNTPAKPDNIDDLEEMDLKIRLPPSSNSESQQELPENSTDEKEEQYALDVLVKEHSDVEVIYSQDHKISHLTTEFKLYKKEHEELEMQMEQLALDYEILKQENHDISTKLEQTQLREQLRMHYECSAQFASISEFEAHFESLEKELVRQAEAFEANLAIISRAKVEQEKRAIQAEDALRRTRLYNGNTAEQMQEEFKRLNAQMSSAFYMNEKLVMQTLKESSELQLRKCQLENVLEKTNEELELVRHEHNLKCKQLFSLIDFKTKEVDSLYLELKEKRKEFENQRMSDETKQRASSEQIIQLKAEAAKLVEQIKLKGRLIEEMDQLKASIAESNMLLQDCKDERSILEEELSLLKEEARKTRHELNVLRQLKVDNDAIIRNLHADVAMYKAQYKDLKHSMLEEEEEKENLRKQVVLLRGDLRKEAGIIAIIEKKLKDHNVKLINSEGSMKSSTKCKNSISTQGQLGLQDAAGLLEKAPLPEWNTEVEDKTNMKNVDSVDAALVTSNSGDNPETHDERSILCTCEQKMSKVLIEMAKLKEQNQLMETELKDMQERYSEMSLKFAEVEGERQQLVIKIRSLKNAC